MTTRRPPTVRALWRADRTRVAHARVGREPRTLCGLVPVAERFAWPHRTKCPTCRQRLTEREEVATAKT